MDITSIYTSSSSPEIADDINNARVKVDAFIKNYKDSFNSLITLGNWQKINSVIQEYEIIIKQLYKVYNYANLLIIKNTENEAIITDALTYQRKIKQLHSDIIFFEWILSSLTFAQADLIYNISWQNPIYKDYRDYIKTLILKRKKNYTTEISGYSFYLTFITVNTTKDLYNNYLNKINFSYNNVNYKANQIQFLLNSHERAVRSNVSKSINATLSKNNDVFTDLINNSFNDLITENNFNDYNNSLEFLEHENNITTSTITSLTNITSLNNFANTYYKIKSQQESVAILEHYDTKSPFLKTPSKIYQWHDIKDKVIKQFSYISLMYHSFIEKFFDDNKILIQQSYYDYTAIESVNLVPAHGAYIVTNFNANVYGNIKDVALLGQQLGIALNKELTYIAQPYSGINSQSVLIESFIGMFGSLILLDDVKNDSSIISLNDKKQRSSQIIEFYIENLIMPLIYHDFESAFYVKRKVEKLSTEEINQIWINSHKKYLGDSVNFNAEYNYSWIFISSFFTKPFNNILRLYGNIIGINLWQINNTNPNLILTNKITFLMQGINNINYNDLLVNILYSDINQLIAKATNIVDKELNSLLQ